jgi:hypothetical protein
MPTFTRRLKMTFPMEVMGGCILSGKKEAKENVSDASPRSVVDGIGVDDVCGSVSRVLSL